MSSGVTILSTSDLDLRMVVEKTIAAVAGPRSTTDHGDNMRARMALMKGSSQCECTCVCAEFRVLSLLLVVCRSTFGVMAEIWAKF